MSVSSGGAGGEGRGEAGDGLTRAQAIRRAAATGSGVLAAGGVLLGVSPQQAGAEEEMKDEVQQFAELRGQVEKKGREDAVRGCVCYLYSFLRI